MTIVETFERVLYLRSRKILSANGCMEENVLTKREFNIQNRHKFHNYEYSIWKQF